MCLHVLMCALAKARQARNSRRQMGKALEARTQVPVLRIVPGTLGPGQNLTLWKSLWAEMAARDWGGPGTS